MKIIWYPAVSRDGFITTLDGDSDWVIEADEQCFDAEVRQAGCTIVGRTTFEQYKGSIYPVVGAMTYVVTSHADRLPTEEGVTYVRPNAAEIISKIQDDGFATAILSGGGETNALFAAAGAIDEVIMSIYPITLGKGIPKLGSFTGELNLELLSSQELGQGVVQNRYTVRGKKPIK